MINIDGVDYKVNVGALQRYARVLDGGNEGLTVSGAYRRDILGTYYDYLLTIKTNQQTEADYDALYEVITDPSVEYHEVTLPYGQTTLTFKAYVQSVSDRMTINTPATKRWKNLQVRFYAQRPQRTVD